MVDLDGLARRARRAAEWGHLRRASRVAFVVIPLTLLATLVSPNRGTIAAFGLLLLAVTVALGWRNAEGARAARSGLKLGSIRMAVGLFTIAVEGWCDPDRTITLRGVGCLSAGVFAGVASAWYAIRAQAPSRVRVWAQIGIITSFTTALGCIGWASVARSPSLAQWQQAPPSRGCLRERGRSGLGSFVINWSGRTWVHRLGLSRMTRAVATLRRACRGLG